MRKLYLFLMMVSFIWFVGLEKASAKSIPSFTLKDPDGVAYSSKEIVKNGMILVVTVSNMSQSVPQKGWNELLEKTKPAGGARLVFIEDMTSSAFNGTANKEMKKDYKEGDATLLLIDGTGSVRAQLGASKNSTVVLAYNSKGELVDTCRSQPSEARAKELWGKIK